MKFGKHLQKRQLDIPEYAASFVNYKALKKLIKQLSATPPILAQKTPSEYGQDAGDPQSLLQANRATFFFRLERELEKVNAFYVQKEADLQLRLKTLVDKKRVIQARNSSGSKASAGFITLEEGFQQFGSDLNKLQQFIEINNTAFSKILKKWDKTAKSRTKELYLSRAVEVQPCFNRDVISALSDQAQISSQELEAWAEGENVRSDSDRLTEHTVTSQTLGTEYDETDCQISQAASTGNTAALQDWIARLQTSPDAKRRFTRIFLSAISDAPESSLTTILASGMVDIHAEDEVTERNCLHEAAISGSATILSSGLRNQVDVTRADVYGRLPLHYACMFGHVEIIQALSSLNVSSVNAMDHDNYTPLLHAIAQRNLESVQQLLVYGARLDALDESDHNPLNLACQYGSTSIVRLLLAKGAKLLADAEGLYPQHLVARSGVTPEILFLLEQHGANLDQRDNLYQWTPLFHAASEGRTECLKLLLQTGADKSLEDEKGQSALYYAAWEGHLECMQLLGFGSVLEGDDQTVHSYSQKGRHPENSDMHDAPGGNDGIPDLSLPPPIIPLRRYGHNFLDGKTLVQINFSNAEKDGISFYNQNKYPAARLTIASKTSDVIPRNILLPIQEDNRMISFQVDNLDNFSIDFEVYPTFGSRMIARSVALPNHFRPASRDTGRCFLPTFDPRLQVIGQIGFDFQVIKPFHGMALDIANFAMYWRATSQLDTHPKELITGSSLSGDFVQLFVQQTKDGVTVLYPHWSINCQDIEIPIARLTYEQCKKILPPSHTAMEISSSTATEPDLAEIHKVLSASMTPLRDALSHLPIDINVNLTIIYPTPAEESAFGINTSQNINALVDGILTDVFELARSTKEQNPSFVRSIVFSSDNLDVCTALNWKQPNYPVLLSNRLGARSNADHRSTISAGINSSQGSLSIKEAVRMAQSNNFMGLLCNAQLLHEVPSLAESIKVAGLVLVVDRSEENGTKEAANRNGHVADGVDGILKSNGVLKFNDMIDV